MASSGSVIDHHVHLQLVDPRDLSRCGVGRVVDLGSGAGLDLSAVPVPVDRAGRFLTAPGGYPSNRSWAPSGSVREVHGVEDAAVAVAEQVVSGAVLIKVTLHSGAGPVLDLATLRAVVDAAGCLPVVAHAEGPGMVELSLDGGCTALAHTPWTERVEDSLLTRAAGYQAWISTLAIHDGTTALPVALDNLRRFHAAEGRVLYGTDLGNGDQPVGVNRRELALLREAGLDDVAVLRATTDPWPRS